MVSYDYEAWDTAETIEVLILVVMEDGLVLSKLKV